MLGLCELWVVVVDVGLHVDGVWVVRGRVEAGALGAELSALEVLGEGGGLGAFVLEVSKVIWALRTVKRLVVKLSLQEINTSLLVITYYIELLTFR